MDKKRVLLTSIFFVFLLTASLVSGEIILNGPDQTSVNIGDDITLTGYVLQTEDTLGLLYFDLLCGSDKETLMVKSMSLKAGQKKDFIDTFAIVTSTTGSCSITASLHQQGTVLETKTSSTFTITPALTGTFTLSKEAMQAGETINVKGNTYKQNGGLVEGFAIITLTKDGTTFLAESREITKGKLDAEINTLDMPGGEYTVSVEVRNNFGNFLITDVGTLILVSNIDVNAHTAKVRYLPKEKVKLTGTASILDGKLKNGDVYITLDDNSYEDTVKNGEFSLDFYLLNTITSGKHDLNIRVEDEQGNVGTYAFALIVDPIATSITIAANTQAINPGETISLKAFLKDQADDPIDEPVTIKVYNDKKDIYYDSVKQSGEQFDVALADNVEPGNYRVEATFGSVTEEIFFAVGEVTLLDYALEGQELVITNVGNVPYQNVLQIELINIDKTSSISETINLAIGQVEHIDLGKGMVTGTYNIVVNDASFENVAITGVSGLNYQWLAYPGALLFLIFFWYVLRNSNKRVRRRIQKQIRGHPNRKHGEFGGAPLTRVNNEKEHVEKFQAYMHRAASFNKKEKRSLFRSKKERTTSFMFGKKRKQAVDESPVDNVFSGVRSQWKRDDVTVYESKKKKDDDDDKNPPTNMFGLFD